MAPSLAEVILAGTCGLLGSSTASGPPSWSPTGREPHRYGRQLDRGFHPRGRRTQLRHFGGKRFIGAIDWQPLLAGR